MGKTQLINRSGSNESKCIHMMLQLSHRENDRWKVCDDKNSENWDESFDIKTQNAAVNMHFN